MIASGGIVRKNWIHGSIRPRATAYQPIRKPTGTAAAEPSSEPGQHPRRGWPGRPCRSVPSCRSASHAFATTSGGVGKLQPGQGQRPPDRDPGDDRDGVEAAGRRPAGAGRAFAGRGGLALASRGGLVRSLDDGHRSAPSRWSASRLGSRPAAGTRGTARRWPPSAPSPSASGAARTPGGVGDREELVARPSRRPAATMHGRDPDDLAADHDLAGVERHRGGAERPGRRRRRRRAAPGRRPGATWHRGRRSSSVSTGDARGAARGRGSPGPRRRSPGSRACRSGTGAPPGSTVTWPSSPAQPVRAGDEPTADHEPAADAVGQPHVDRGRRRCRRRAVPRPARRDACCCRRSPGRRTARRTRVGHASWTRRGRQRPPAADQACRVRPGHADPDRLKGAVVHAVLGAEPVDQRERDARPARPTATSSS